MLKKIAIISTASLSILFSQNLNIVKGWNNIGFSKCYNVKLLADEYDSFKYFWYFSPVTKKWSFFSKDTSLMQKIKEYGYSQIPDKLALGSAIWVYADNNVSLDLSNVTLTNTIVITSSYYGNNYYALISKNGKPYLAISSNRDKWETLIPLDLKSNSQEIKEWKADIFARKENNVIFSFVTRDINNSSQTAWVGWYKDGKIISLKDVANVKSGYISFNGIYTSSDSNDTQYIIFEKNSWRNGNNDDLIIVKKKADEKLEISSIDNILNVNYNYTYIYRDNANELKRLNNISVITYLPYKTITYVPTSNSLDKQLEMDGIWRTLLTYNTSDIHYSIMEKSYYPYNSNSNKLALIYNNNIEYAKFDHIVRAVGVSRDEIYSFTHDDIGDDLYIYKSTDNGKNWDLVKKVPNFNYQINYVNSIYKNNDDKIHCDLVIDNYHREITSDDSFETWKVSNKNYRKNTKYMKKDFVEKRELDGSITLFKK